MTFTEVNKALFNYLDHSPNAFFAVKNMQDALDQAGFQQLREADSWHLLPGYSYYVTRNMSSLIAFRIPEKPFRGFQIMASHSDSPAFKIKPNAEIEINGKYRTLNAEKYGGMLCAPWLDRPLSIAGRILLSTENGISAKLVNIDRDLVIIPNLAIHMNRQSNDGYSWNAQKDMLPLLGSVSGGKDLIQLVAEAAAVSPESILDTDLFLYNRMHSTYIGADQEYIAGSRLDDLQCAFASLQGILHAEPYESIAVHCVFDNEEVGSLTKQGAASTFLSDTLKRIAQSFDRNHESYLQALANSFMVSADNAHAVHPNHTDKADPTNRPHLNEGIVIKYSANQKYTTDAVSGALFRKICEHAEVPFQTFTNRSDMLGGSTLGNIAQAQAAINTVDIGLPQLAMHSPFETAGAKDTAYLVKAAQTFFSSFVECIQDGEYRLHFNG